VSAPRVDGDAVPVAGMRVGRFEQKAQAAGRQRSRILRLL